MDATKWMYFQFRKSFDYPVYVRFKQENMNQKFTHLLQELGFSSLNESDLKKIQLQKPYTRILTVTEGNARLQMQMNGSDLLNQYGPESLSLQAGMPVYTYRKVAVMGLPSGRNLWDLALWPDISNTDQMVGLRVVLVRFLAQALSEQGILSYWGTVKGDAVVIMKQAHSFGEAIFIDLQKKSIFSNGGEMKMPAALKILRRDQEGRSSLMSREDLIGFLSVSTCLLSFSGISSSMKKAIYDLSSRASGAYAPSDLAPNL